MVFAGLTAVGVDEVGDLLEGEEGDSNGQEDFFEDEIGPEGRIGPQGEGIYHLDVDAGEFVTRHHNIVHRDML